MPVLKNQRHEIFAQELAKGKTNDEAYVLAGYPENRGNAARLKATESIAARVQELQERGAKRTEITIEKLTAMYLEDRRLAQEAKQFAVSKGAADSLAKLHGFMVEKREIRTGTIDDLDAESRDAVLDSIDRELARRERKHSPAAPRKPN